MAWCVVLLAVLSSTVLVRQDHGHGALLATLTWVDGFAHSPGLGGLAAVGAASVALAQWRRHERDRRESAEAARRLAQDAHWWETYRILRAEVPGTTYVDHALVDALVTVADTEIQSAAAASLASALPAKPPTDTEEDPHAGRPRT
ncbi:hypothetical protein EBM89_15760 [Cellulomonas triticagri]|uniref:Uncharacterized protein n=1 Tax=Cellulomonas triticagri TaxID=2483352 RepID=A0A3M2IXJ1_9CELL|nr:hypothetical protein EBM89_15760 [Cellulomonas triticagri]